VTGFGAAVRTAQVRVGDNVVVVGCGGIGLNVVQGARLAGARRIIAVDVHPAKLELASIFGATSVVDASDADVVERVVALSEGGVDHAFEAVGSTATAHQALKMLAPGGTAFLIGGVDAGTVWDVDLLDFLIDRKGVRAVGLGSTIFQVDIPLYVDLYLQRRLMLDELVSRTIGIDEINDAYDELNRGGIARSVITFE
jgi:S-(hydroxymethyl)glutathione dehydrogenase/alcohol dehydrogenase